MNSNLHLIFLPHTVKKFIDAEIKAGIAPERIVIGGFSQGGSVALKYGVGNAETKLGGLIGLSCWLPLHTEYLAGGLVSYYCIRLIQFIRTHFAYCICYYKQVL